MRKIKFLSILALTTLLSGAALFISILEGRSQAVEAAELLTDAAQKLAIPQPGQIAHYTYEIYHRPPPPGLEPTDPYHLPYAEIWRERQVEHTWLEISPDGRTTRWRTQLFGISGELLQDLVFDGQTEVDYFPALGWAKIIPGTTVSSFTDDRVALFKDFQTRSGLARHNGLSLDGEQVVSVNAQSVEFENLESIEGALLSFQNPFVADLQPTAIGLRIDFDPVTSLAVGQAQVVYDSSGKEHIVSYRTMSNPEILTPDDPRLDGIFKLDLPDGVVIGNDNGSQPPGTTLTDLARIIAEVTFPLYHIPDGAQGFQLVSVDYTIPAVEANTPKEFLAIDFAPSIGAGVRTVYVIPGSSPAPTAAITLIQGTPNHLAQSLRATRPTWLNAKRTDFLLSNQSFPGWILSGGKDGQQLRYVIETPLTLMYLDTQGLTIDQFRSLLEEMIRVDQIKE